MSVNDSKNNYKKSAVISGATGIVCNILLSTAKLIAGFSSGSVAIITDGFNNFSDAAANVITIIGARMSRKPMDKEHPFGHGRIEYIAALIVAFSVFTVSVELFRESLSRIFVPSSPAYSLKYILVLAVSILIKAGMALLNHKLFKLSGNICLKAVRLDCLSDCVVTAAAILSLICTEYFGIIRADGAIGLLIACFIFFSGIIILKEILNPLLGQAPTREIVYKIEENILNNNIILDVSEIIVHSYGNNSTIASARAAVPAESKLIDIHTMIDGIETEIMKSLGINITIHIDPI